MHYLNIYKSLFKNKITKTLNYMKHKSWLSAIVIFKIPMLRRQCKRNNFARLLIARWYWPRKLKSLQREWCYSSVRIVLQWSNMIMVTQLLYLIGILYYGVDTVQRVSRILLSWLNSMGKILNVTYISFNKLFT